MTMHNAHMILHGVVGVGVHDAIIPPATVTVPWPYASAFTLLGMNVPTKAKPAPTVLGQGGIPLVARGNDSGYGVPHIPLPPPDSLQAVTILLGGSKVLFGSSKTLIAVAGKGEQCGCCLPPCVPLSYNMACNAPLNGMSDLVIAPNTVEVGMTLGDLITGIVSAGLEMVVSLAAGWGAGKLSDQVTGLIARQIAQRSFWQFAGALGVEGGLGHL